MNIMNTRAVKCRSHIFIRKLAFIVLITLLATFAHSDRTLMNKQRVKRRIPLLFPGPSAYTLIMGFGVPVTNLEYETVVSGCTLRTKFRLPTKGEDTRPHYGVVNIERKLSSTFGTNNTDDINVNHYFRKLNQSLKSQSKYRWMFYKAMAMLSEHYGYPGRSCVLKSICEVAAVPFDYKNGILGEVLHLLMTPTSSRDVIASHADNEYLHAEALGRLGAPCQYIFKECTSSMLGYFTEIMDF